MRDGSPNAIYRKDYTPPTHSVDTVDMTVAIYPGTTRVTTTLALRSQTTPPAPLELDGEGLVLESVAIDGEVLAGSDYRYADGKLVIPDAPAACALTTVVTLCPEENTSLEGLYRSRTMYCTQCEAEGFRKITFFPDRPDILARFRVTVEADIASCPVLLSNGNRVATEALPDGRHRAVWEDPWPKPSYLFALVAGDLACVSDRFTTRSGREVALQVWVEAKDREYCAHAIDSLKRAMRWDEEVYGLEYDLDLYNIVAVDDFNMGAMENKGLNIFNTSCVLAAPDITTDQGYQRVEAVVAHEYFHNYSGNRVTCRDWFQLSLKEGFTVFRDSEFSADMHSRGVKRVEDVAFLRTHQFAEDAGPMAHPVRPDSFIEISNFYTLTVYEKGAEVVRMLHTLLGAETFQRGAALYFERHDGQAVTCDDFVTAMEDAAGRDLAQFRRWYEQAGTPELTVSGEYDAAARRYTLSVRQENRSGASDGELPPLLIPVSVGLIVEGAPLTLAEGSTTRVLELTERQQSFVFEDVPAAPVPSLLRDFSAPVRVVPEPDIDTLIALMRGDDNAFVRWDAAQSLAAQVIETTADGEEPDPRFVAAFGEVLRADIEPAMKAHTLALPNPDYLADRAAQHGKVDVFAIHARRERVKQVLARQFAGEWSSLYTDLATTAAYRPDGEQIGRRALRHLALHFLCYLDTQGVDAGEALYASADNLSDRLAAARAVVNFGDAQARTRVLARFYDDWSDQALVVNQWFSLQAMRPAADTVEDVRGLLEHPAFDWRNPNKLRALVGAFASANPLAFHRADGSGYELLGDVVARIQAGNPQIAARMLTPLTRYRRYAHGVAGMRGTLERVAALDDLSRDVFEVVNRSLAD